MNGKILYRREALIILMEMVILVWNRADHFLDLVQSGGECLQLESWEKKCVKKFFRRKSIGGVWPAELKNYLMKETLNDTRPWSRRKRMNQ